MCNNENRENKKLTIDDLKFYLDGYIDETTDTGTTVPRAEYDALISKATILRAIKQMIDTIKYDSDKLEAVRALLGVAFPEPEPDAPHEPDPDEGDAE